MYPNRTHRQQAAVLSGGGAKGSFQVGVLRALAQGASPANGYRPLHLDVLTGASVGGYNAAFLAAQHQVGLAESVARLEKVWRHRIAKGHWYANGVFRLRGLPAFEGPWLSPVAVLRALGSGAADASYLSSYLAVLSLRVALAGTAAAKVLLRDLRISELFDLAPFHRLIRETIDRRALAATRYCLEIMATDFASGQVRGFDQVDIADTYGPDAIIASATLPGLFPITTIDGVPYIDGGATDNTPIVQAILHGAGVLHVIYLEPLLEVTPLPLPPGTMRVLYRLGKIMIGSQPYDYMESVRELNQVLCRSCDSGAPLSAAIRGIDDWDEDPLLTSVHRAPERLSRLPIEIHRYRPYNDLGGALGLLDMSRQQIDRNIVEGYRAAVEHRCDVEGCVVPSSSVASAADALSGQAGVW